MASRDVSFNNVVCPLPLQHKDQIVIGHGSGGRMTQDLIRAVFAKHLSNPILDRNNDAADVHLEGFQRISISVDSHIVNPIFFPGGDIGKLAICGTVNDISMLGAIPAYITAGFILEEGFPISNLERIVSSMRAAANEADVKIVAGDTKVVEKGKADQIFITTSGVGLLANDLHIGGEFALPGDRVLISGSIGDHGIAVLSARGDLGLESEILSDIAPLNHMIQALLHAAPHCHVLRDPTRGGVATTLNEIAVQSKVGIILEEGVLPIKASVQAACELLGFDPLYIANEGKLVAILPEEEVAPALQTLKAQAYGSDARLIGEVVPEPAGRVLLKTTIGATRILDPLSGSMLPRIC